MGAFVSTWSRQKYASPAFAPAQNYPSQQEVLGVPRFHLWQQLQLAAVVRAAQRLQPFEGALPLDLMAVGAAETFPLQTTLPLDLVVAGPAERLALQTTQCIEQAAETPQ